MFMDKVLKNDQPEWQIIEDKLHQARLDFKPTIKSSDSTNEDEDDETFKRFNDIRGLCDEFAWNVLNNDSNIFTFTTYKVWDKLSCSLSDVDLNSTYEYVCQYGS